MTITILCAGALARPGAQSAEIEPDPAAPRAAWLPAAQLRQEVRAAEQARLPESLDDGAFARTLRRARIVSRSRLEEAAPAELPSEAWLRTQFDLDGTVAACTLPPPESQAPEVVVRPVHLHLGLDQIVLAPLAQLAITAHEAQALAAATNAWLVDEGLVATPVRADAWRLRACAGEEARREIDALGALQAPSARNASGRNVEAWQPTGTAQRRWRQLSTLVQMSWFEHPVNEARESQGQLPINALWLEGRAGEARRRPFASVWANEETIAGLGRRAGVASQVVCFETARDDAARAEPARDAGVAAAMCKTGSDELIVPGFWDRALDEGDAATWVRAWSDFDRWFGRSLLPAARENTLRIVLTGERDTIELVHERADRWKAWRRLRLAALVSGAQ